jgi:hypothetical protein
MMSMAEVEADQLKETVERSHGGTTKRRFFAVLHQPLVESTQAPVRTPIMAEHRQHRKRRRTTFTAALAFAAIWSILNAQAVSADSHTSVESAFRLCSIFDRMGTLSEKCKVSGSDSSVSISIGMSAGDCRRCNVVL